MREMDVPNCVKLNLGGLVQDYHQNVTQLVEMGLKQGQKNVMIQTWFQMMGAPHYVLMKELQKKSKQTKQ